MKTCPQEINVERWFDGAAMDAAAVQSHLDGCLACRAYLAGLEHLRAGFAVRKAVPEIGDAQLPAFLRQLQDRVETAPAARPLRFWTMVSAAAAALVVTVSVLSIVSTGPKPIEATVVEQRSTEIQGATTTVSVADDGTTTVWVNVPEGDMW
jgi:anti-sigma factor RsiW